MGSSRLDFLEASGSICPSTSVPPPGDLAASTLYPTFPYSYFKSPYFTFFELVTLSFRVSRPVLLARVNGDLACPSN
jgi:hypothetical protein